MVFRGSETTADMPNKLVDILEKTYLITREVFSGAIWYELSHERFIEAIINTNKRYDKEKYNKFRNIFRENDL